MKNKDCRWKQRFYNFEKALNQLKKAILLKNPSEIEKAGTIQIYEFTFELAWKTLKNFLEENNVEVTYPRDTIKEAFSHDLIDNGDIWMDMLEKRNLMSHTYNEKTADTAHSLIVNSYFQAIEQVHGILLKNQ